MSVLSNALNNSHRQSLWFWHERREAERLQTQQALREASQYETRPIDRDAEMGTQEDESEEE